MKAILCGFNPKEVNDFIIAEGKQGWQFSSLFRKIIMYNYDTMFRSDRGLKALEGFMGNDIKETSVPFDIDRRLTPEELSETIKYCRHDVEQTIEVFFARKDKFDAQMGLIKMFHLPLSDMSRTLTQLSAKVLDAHRPRESRGDEFDISFPNTLCIDKYVEVVNWYKNPNNRDYSKSLTIKVAGVETQFGWGGIHSAVPKYVGEGYFINMDVTSLYPSLMILYNLYSRNIKDPQKYVDMYHTRVKFKAEKNPLQIALKEPLNGSYGAMKDKNNPLYDPLMANNICVHGQLLLLDLMEKLEPYAEIIQSNTDGILIRMPDGKDEDRWFEIIDDIVYEWEQRTGLNMEFDEYRKVFQKDVNNYVAVTPDGKYKSKGSYVKKQSHLDYDLPIVNKAMIEFMVNDIPVEKTIAECNDLIMFQKIVKLSGKFKNSWHALSKYPSDYKDETCKYMKDLGDSRFHLYSCSNPNVHNPDKFGEIDVNRCECNRCKYYETHSADSHGNVKLSDRTFRVFASVKTTDGFIGKQKTDGAIIEKFANTPEHCFIVNDNVKKATVDWRLDKQWYIDKAKERLTQFGVI